MSDVVIRGANQLADVTAAIKRAGDVGLRRELLRGIQQAGKPLKAAGAAAIAENLPQRGGAALAVASRTKVGVRTRTSGRSPGVRVIARSTSHIGAMDRGILRKSVFGNEKVWVTQRIPSGWWESRLGAQAPAVRTQILRAMDRVAAEVARHG